MNTATPDTPLSVLLFHQKISDYLRKSFDKTMIMATVHIEALDGKIELVTSPFSSETEKNLFSAFVRRRCAEVFATMVGFFSETWAFDNEADYLDYKVNEKRYKGSFGNHPKAIEQIIIQIETRQNGAYWSKIPILPGRKLGDTTPLMRLEGIGGRMSFL